MCMEGCKREFSPRNFKLWHWSTDDITKSAWLPLPILLAWRIIIALFCTVLWIYNVAKSKDMFFIYFTNWIFTTVTCFFLTTSLLSLLQCIKERKADVAPENKSVLPSHAIELEPVLTSGGGTSANNYGAGDKETGSSDGNRNLEEDGRQKDALKAQHKFAWLLYNISGNLSLFLAIGYWTVIYDPSENQSFVGITKHFVIAIFCVIDTGSGGFPVRIYHTVYSLAFAAVYLIFTIIYWKAGGKDTKGNPYVYKQLNYGNMTAKDATVLGFFLLFVLPVAQVVYFGLVKLRNKLVACRRGE